MGELRIFLEYSLDEAMTMKLQNRRAGARIRSSLSTTTTVPVPGSSARQPTHMLKTLVTLNSPLAH